MYIILYIYIIYYIIYIYICILYYIYIIYYIIYIYVYYIIYIYSYIYIPFKIRSGEKPVGYFVAPYSSSWSWFPPIGLQCNREMMLNPPWGSTRVPSSTHPHIKNRCCCICLYPLTYIVGHTSPLVFLTPILSQLYPNPTVHWFSWLLNS